MSNEGMMQRCWEHDYCAACFYMITVVTEPRRDCLGTLHVQAGDAATVALSPLGKVVREVWRRTSAVYPGVEACEWVVMPDHFHGILWVKERLTRLMGHIVKAFKRVSAQECRSRELLLPPNRGSVPAAAPAVGLWQQGFQDSILLRRGQLQAMAAYIADNPRRLATKRANPVLFTVAANLEILPGKTAAAIGNRFLLRHPLKRQIQVSRRISPRDLAALQEELLYAAEHGAVLVSPCISPGEKTVARAALDAARPLMIAPFPDRQRRQTITREQCLVLNTWAEGIVEKPSL